MHRHHAPRLVPTFAVAIVTVFALTATNGVRAEEKPTLSQQEGTVLPPTNHRKGGPGFARANIITAQHQYEGLHKAILANMELTEEEKVRIDRIFSVIHEQLETGRGTPGALSDTNASRRFVAKNDRPKALRSTQDMARFKNATRPSRQTAAITPFTSRRVGVDIISEEFHGLQLKEFLKLAGRWDALQPIVGLYDGPIMRLRRSTLDPALGASASEVEDFQIMIAERMKAFGRDRFDEAETTVAADELRTKILERLTPRQQEHLLATNRALDEDAKILREKIAKAEAKAKAAQEAPSGATQPDTDDASKGTESKN